MREQATLLGFEYSHKGCPCIGSPIIYKKIIGGRIYQLFIWEKRDAWRLSTSGTKLASGNSSDLTPKINEIWDLFKMS